MKNLSITMAEFKELVEENQNDLKMLLDSLPKGWFLCFVYESPEDGSPVKGVVIFGKLSSLNRRFSSRIGTP